MVEALSTYARGRLQRCADDLLGEEVTLRLHRGHPGPDYQDNVVGMATLVTRETFADDGRVVFYAERSGVHCVSAWSGGCPISLLVLDDMNQSVTATLLPGDTITISSFPRLRMHAGPR